MTNVQSLKWYKFSDAFGAIFRKCEICGKHLPDSKILLVVDHHQRLHRYSSDSDVNRHPGLLRRFDCYFHKSCYEREKSLDEEGLLTSSVYQVLKEAIF